jgi:WD40 repeat protein
VAGVGDMIWHSIFGIELEVDALFSPTHLMLFTGGILIVSGPLRAALRRPQAARRLPAALSLACVLAVAGAMTQFASPLVSVLARSVPGISGGAADVQPEILTMQPDGSRQTRLTMDTAAGHSEPAWSPDGRTIALVHQSAGKHPVQAIYLMNADGSGPHSVTKGPEDSSPAWSPDGTRLAYSSRANGGKRDVYVVQLATGAAAPLLSTPDDEVVGGWSPDGTRILVASDRAGHWSVAVVDATTGAEKLLATPGANDESPAWSPDGQRIAFASDRDGNLEIYSMKADGTGPTRLTHDPDGDYEPHWSPDGSRIAFVSWRGGEADVYTMGADGSHVTDISRSPGSHEGGGLSWSAAGITFTSAGNIPFWEAPYFRQALGMASILIQTAILMPLVLLAVRRRVLPFGGLALVFVSTAALMGLVGNEYRLVPGAFVAGLAADLLVRRLHPSTDTRGFRVFAFAVPALYYVAYFAGVQAAGGVGWTIHMWTGAIVIAGIIGVLLSYLIVPPPQPEPAS